MLKVIIYQEIVIKQEQTARSKLAMACRKAEHAPRPNKNISIVSKAASRGPCIESLMIL